MVEQKKPVGAKEEGETADREDAEEIIVDYVL